MRWIRALLQRRKAEEAPLEEVHRSVAVLWKRAERLRLLHSLEGEEPALHSAEILESGLFNPSRYHLALMDGITMEDYGLFTALREALTEFRERQYAALERLAMVIGAEEGATFEERENAAIWNNPMEVARSLDELGWLSEHPVE